MDLSFFIGSGCRGLGFQRFWVGIFWVQGLGVRVSEFRVSDFRVCGSRFLDPGLRIPTVACYSKHPRRRI